MAELIFTDPREIDTTGKLVPTIELGERWYYKQLVLSLLDEGGQRIACCEIDKDQIEKLRDIFNDILYRFR